MENKFKVYGLCAGHHDLPVSEYVFEDVPPEMIFNFTELNAIAEQFVTYHCNTRVTLGTGVSQNDNTDVFMWAGDPLHVIATGSTACTTALMWACARYGVELVLWHYNRDNGNYVPQHFNFYPRYTEVTWEDERQIAEMLAKGGETNE